MHIIFTGFSYPNGMAGTKRNEHAIRVLTERHDVSINVLSTRQSTKINPPKGTHKSIEYETIMPDTLRAEFAMKYPFYFRKAQKAFKKIAWKSSNKTKILYIYGRPSLDSIPLVLAAKKTGYLVVFDIVEDDSLAFYNSQSIWSKTKNIITRALTQSTLKKADGIVVISTHLLGKVKQIVSKSMPLYLRPISVDFSKYKNRDCLGNNWIDLLYSGSFAKKDGVDLLLKAFDRLAEKNSKVRLLMTGMSKAASSIKEKIQRSPHRNRIVFLGYLSDQDYYNTIKKAYILCVPRIDDPYAHAGFPFKLGEFLATGNPVIVSKTGDVNYYLKHNESAVLLEPGSSQSIYNAVLYLIENPQKARAIGQKGYGVAKTHFDHVVQGDRLLSFLDNLDKHYGVTS